MSACSGRAVWRRRKAELEAAYDLAEKVKSQRVIRVDVDVLQARIQRGFGGRFEAELVGVMARSLITGEAVKLIYNDVAYTVRGAV